jgi:hypothetical protein
MSVSLLIFKAIIRLAMFITSQEKEFASLFPAFLILPASMLASRGEVAEGCVYLCKSVVSNIYNL